MERANLVRLWALVVAICLLAVAEPAFAFCRTTTCDPSVQKSCRTDTNGCVIDGKPLYWSERCLSFATQRDGSPKRKISYGTADEIFRQSFIQWVSADCGGSGPSFEMWDIGAPYGGVICNEPEFNETLPNANVWMFRDNDWPHENEGSTLAVTTVLFERSTGIILGADVEINSFARNLTTTDDPRFVQEDLQSIATHEAGHFLGLSHTLIKGATMNAAYNQGDLAYRTLHEDDRKGICAVYPPDRDAPACTAPRPPHGFSLYCGADHEPGPIGGCAYSAPGKNVGTSSRVVALLVVVSLSVAAFRIKWVRTRRRKP